MPSAKQKALELIFKQQAKKGPVLFRNEDSISHLAGKPFSRFEQTHMPDVERLTGEPKGVFYAREPLDIPSLVEGPPTRAVAKQWMEEGGFKGSLRDFMDPQREFIPNIKAVPTPEARYRKMGPHEILKASQDAGGDSVTLTKKLAKDYDLLEFPDLFGRYPNESVTQTVQLNPRTTIRRFKDELGKTKYKIFGGAAAAGAASQLGSPEESEAFPLGKFSKTLTKTAKEGMESSAAARLVGHSLKGKIITNVKKGDGNWRSLLFEDGSEMTVTKDELHALTRAKGTADYAKTFTESNDESQLTQAMKSLKYHEVRADNRPFDTAPTKRLYHQRYLTDVNQGDPKAVPETVFVNYQGKYFQMPKEKAELLEEQGYLTIDKKHNVKPRVTK
jgi:hypothetical protein